MVALFGRAPRGRPARFDAAKGLAFMHVPKTAGSSLTAAIARAVQPDSVVSGFDRVLFGGFAEFGTFDQELRRAIFLEPSQIPAAAFVSGHMALSTLRQHDASAQVMTVLREPVSRLLSHWLFWRGHDDERLAPWGAWADRVRLSRLPLLAFLSAPELACQNDNLAVRMLLWPHRLVPADGFIDPRHDGVLLAQARRALDSLAFSDIVENPELTRNIAAFLGRAVQVCRMNETARVPDGLRVPLERELTVDAYAALTRCSRLDLELWRRAGRLSWRVAGAFRERVLVCNVARFSRVSGG